MYIIPVSCEALGFCWVDRGRAGQGLGSMDMDPVSDEAEEGWIRLAAVCLLLSAVDYREGHPGRTHSPVNV